MATSLQVYLRCTSIEVAKTPFPDLDSMTSSILFAYLKSTAPPKGAFSPIYIPLLNIHQSGIRLRPEFTSVCESSGIKTSQLLCLDDIEPGFENATDTAWIMVDHNKLQGQLGDKYTQRVRGVIDHHEEEDTVPSETAPEPRIVQKAGSCTSLVIDYCRSIWGGISDASLVSGAGNAQGELAINDAAVTRGWDAQVAKLAMASILIDTANLTAPGKVEQVDTDAIDYLEAKIFLSAKDARIWNRSDYFDLISNAKQQIDHLLLEEILLKDYKQWEEDGRRLGISSMVKPLAFLIEKAGKTKESQSFDQVIQNFMRSHDLSVFAVMTAFKSVEGEFQRELLLQDNTPKHQAATKFCESALEALNLEELDVDTTKHKDFSDSIIWRNSWNQGDLAKSRKQVAPMLRESLR